jgi:Uri superfamily endonuclease
MECDNTIEIGRLGNFNFPKGYYAYAGSALGPGGLTSRIRHHLNPAYRAHWHVDYLRRKAVPEETWVCEQKKKREHQWASLLKNMKGSAALASGFGSSDCTCKTHLFHFQERPLIQAFKKLLLKKFPNHEKILKVKLGRSSDLCSKCASEGINDEVLIRQ